MGKKKRVLSTQLRSPRCYFEKRKKRSRGVFFCLQIGLLGLPDSLDALGETDIVCLELVEANTSEDGGGVESPHGELAGLGHTLGGEVVDDA